MNYSASCHKTSGEALSQGGSPARGDKPPGSRISVEEGLLILRWSTEHALEALESAGMTLQDLLAKHAVPRLEARKGIYIKHRGQITRRLEVEDSDAQLDMAVLLGHVLGMYPDD